MIHNDEPQQEPPGQPDEAPPAMQEIEQNSMMQGQPSPFQEQAQDDGIDHTNYALDDEKVERFKREIVSLMPMIEAQRVTLEERWNRYHHAWARKNTTESRFYTGINDAYFPEVYKNIEALVAYLYMQCFPAGLLFAIKASNPMVPPQAIQKLAALFTYYTYISRIEEEFIPFTRQGVNFGPTAASVTWKDETVKIYKPQLVLDPTTGQQVVQPVSDEIVRYRGPTFETIDMLSLYVYPYQVRNIQDARIIYRKVDRDFRDIAQHEGEAYLGTNRLMSSQEMAQNSRDAIRRDTNWNFRTAPYGLSTYQIRDPNQITLNEIYCMFDLYGQGYVQPCKAVVANDIVLELKQNPFWDQEWPGVYWRAIDHMDHIYGMGYGELGEHHQYTINAFINQALDALLYQSNQIIAIDASRYQGRLGDIQFAPLTVFGFDGPGPVKDALEFHKPENTALDIFPVVNIVAGSMADTFGTPPVVRGQFSNKERTATEVSATAQGATIRIDMMVRNLQLHVLQRWLQKAFKLSQQAIDPVLEFKATGMPPLQMSIDDVDQMPIFQPIVGAEAQQLIQQQQMMQQAQMQAQLKAKPVGQGGRPEPTVPGSQMPGGPQSGLADNAGIGGGSGPG